MDDYDFDFDYNYDDLIGEIIELQLQNVSIDENFFSGWDDNLNGIRRNAHQTIEAVQLATQLIIASLAFILVSLIFISVLLTKRICKQ